MEKRPFKANPLIRFFGKTGLPKNWQKILKEISTVCEVDQKSFFSWDYSLQLAAIFLSKLDTSPNSKKNTFKLGKEITSSIWMINKINNLNEIGISEVKKCLNRPKIISKLLVKKEIKEGDSELFLFLPEMELYNIEKTVEHKNVLKTMKEMVRKEDHDEYFCEINKLTSIYRYKKEFTGKFIQGKVGSITYKVEKSTRSLFLDSASDCCQGIGKAGESCMRFGITQSNSSFLVFSRKDKVFAQSWFYTFDNMIVLDSIETKGEFNESLVETMKVVLKELKKHYKYVIIGKSPNLEGKLISSFLKNHDSRQLSHYTLSIALNDNLKKMKEKYKRHLYSDIKNGYFVF